MTHTEPIGVGPARTQAATENDRARQAWAEKTMRDGTCGACGRPRVDSVEERRTCIAVLEAR